MKKSELYHLINSLIQKSKEQKNCKDQSHPQFVTNYCQQFLKRNKLIPKSKNSKIKQIMKGFQNLDSYVDLNDIVKAIHEHINTEMSKQQKNQLKAKQRLKQILKSKTQPSQHVPKFIQTIQKADAIIRKTYREGYYMQLNKCAKIVETLESTSNQLNNVKYKNYANGSTYHDLLNTKFVQGRRRFQNQQNRNFEPSQPNQNQKDQTIIKSCKILQKNNPWRMLQQKYKKIGQLSRFQKTTVNQTSLIENSLLDLKSNNSESKDKNHKSHFDYSKMLHSSAVYLHLILEREHYKKWALQKKSPDVDDEFKQAEKTTTQNTNTASGPSQFNQFVRSTCTQQDSECKGLQKEERDQIQQYNWFHRKQKNKSNKLFRVKINQKLSKKEELQLKEDNNSKTDLIGKTLKSCKDTKFILNKPNNTCKQERVYLKTEPSIEISSILQTNLSINQQKGSKINKGRASICQPKLLNEKFTDNNENNIPQKKRPRHTLGNTQNIHLLSQLGYDPKIKFNQKEYIQNKQKENKEIRQKFTFKKRKVKQGVLRKITEFVNDVQYAQRNMIIQSKNCQKHLQNIQNRLQFQYGGFQQEKILNDQGALEGVRCALSKASTGLKRYNK